MDDATISMAADDANRPSPFVSLKSWGPFQLIELVGQGSFGAVFRAHDPKLDREVAVKLLRTSAGAAADYSAVLREARIIAKVRHPNVVSVYGVERYDGRVGFWSDFVRGKNLSDVLEAQGPFGARETAAVGIELCRALSAVHAAGLLHRDIKAANAMREEGGRILLMDFGLTQEAAGASGTAGTPAYMAPEIFAGKPPSVATDIYAMGVLLFYLCCGQYPLKSRVAESRLHLADQRPDLPEVFTRVVETAIDPDPAKRYRSAGEMLNALSVTMENAAPKSRTKAWYLLALVPLVIAGAMLISKHTTETAASSGGAGQDYSTAQELLKREDKPGNVEKAIGLLKKVTAADARFALGHSELAYAYLLRYRATSAPDLLDQATAEGQTALKLGGSLAPVHVVMGAIYTNRNRYDLAASELQGAVQLDNTNPEAYAQLGKLYAAQGRTSDVMANYQKAIDLGPLDSRWPNLLGNYYLSEGRNAEAAEQYLRVVQLAPDSVYGYINLGIARRRQERFPEAEKALRQALQLDPNSELALMTLGNLLFMQARYTDAVAEYGKAQKIAPLDYRGRANLAAAYQWSGDAPSARVHYQAAIALAETVRKSQPANSAVLANLGSYYAAVGDGASALPLIRQAVALSPENPQILVSAGEGFELSGHRAEAIAAITKALRLGYAAKAIDGSPELTSLRNDPRFRDARHSSVPARMK